MKKINIVRKTDFQVWEKDQDIINIWNLNSVDKIKLDEVELFFKVTETKQDDYILQEVLPDCNPIFWEIIDGKISEMADYDKQIVYKRNLYKNKKAEFFGKNFQVEISSDNEMPGFLYFASTYPVIYTYIQSKGSIIKDVNEINLFGYAYLDEFVEGAFVELLRNDASGRIKINYIETYNPDNLAWYGREFVL